MAVRNLTDVQAAVTAWSDKKGCRPSYACVPLSLAKKLVKSDVYSSIDELERDGLCGMKVTLVRRKQAHFRLSATRFKNTGMAMAPKASPKTIKPAKTKSPIYMQPITNGERSRTYTFPSEFGPQEITVENVTHICVRPSGSHRLKTATGKKLRIVQPGWLSIAIDADEWSL